jgi:hypothetical protein
LSARQVWAQTGPPARILELARQHWTSEKRVHYVRDCVFGVDRSSVRGGAALQVMATLRNLATSILRKVMVSNTASEPRCCARHSSLVFWVVGAQAQPPDRAPRVFCVSPPPRAASSGSAS